MSQKISIRFYNDCEVRAVWSKEQGEWFFAIVDIITAITGSESPRKYWSVLKTRLKRRGNELATNCSQLKLMSADGKHYNTDCIAVSKVSDLAKVITNLRNLQIMKKSLILSFTALLLSAGMWAQDAPAGQIIYEGLLFRNVNSGCVELVKYMDAAPVPYSGDIVVPEDFEFTDSQGKQHPLDVVQIGSEAFADCPDLISVTLPKTIGRIGDRAFANSPKLESVTCLGTFPAWIGENVFSDEMETVIYVPRVAKAAYKAAWSAYADRIMLAGLDAAKEEAIAEITTARQGIINAELNALIDDAINAINNATNQDQITEREHEIFIIMGMYQTGKAEAKTELLGEMGTPCTDCTAVEVTDGTTTLSLYNPTKVSYIKK